MGVPAAITQQGDIVTLGNINFRRKVRWYTVNIVRSAVAGAQFPNQQVQIDPNLAPFLLTSLHAADTADGKPITSQEAWFIQASDNENSYQWCDGPVERSSMFGSREFGFNLPDAVSLRANTRITFTLTNMDAAPTAGTATITLRGWQLIPLG